ncbi:MAG: ROK family protein [Phycisphaerales bacterium]|jgi:polyphosphate glucokinase
MKSTLAIDIGGTHVKIRIPSEMEKREFESGPTLTPKQMVDGVKKLSTGWKFDSITIGLPAPIRNNKPVKNPANLGPGWMDFDYDADFGVPVKIINDAAMQAVGSYKAGRMLFLGLGTGLGSCLIVDHSIVPLELAHMPYRKGKTFEDFVGLRGLKKLGKKRWRKQVSDVCDILYAALLPDEIVIGGGNVKNLKELPDHCRAGDNANAFEGGFRLWQKDWASAVPEYDDKPKK